MTRLLNMTMVLNSAAVYFVAVGLAIAEQPSLSTDLSAWRSPTGQWRVVGDVQLANGNPSRLTATPGEGTLVNGPDGRTVDLLTSADYGDVHVQLEFLIAEHSNSGVYFMGRYEVQIYDSFGVEKDKYPGIECGGIYPRWTDQRGEYEGHSPARNVSRPAGQWQSFDVVFRAPRFDDAGKKVANARFERVTHNGQVVHENVEITGPTRAAKWSTEASTGPLMLQGDHGPVAYRNIRIEPLPRKTSAIGPLKIMPMGDSITHAADPGYRGFLYRRLVDAGYDFDFVGSMNDKPTMPADSDLDPDHEGHGGFSVGPGASRADNWTGGKGNLYVNLDSWLAPDNPQTKDVDIILLHIGVNDLANIGQIDPSYDLVRDFTSRLDGLLAKILSLRPNVAIIVSSVIPGGNPDISAVFSVGPFDKINPQIPAIAQARGTHVFFRDGAALEGTDLQWAPNDWNRGDVVHPNAQGQQKFAEFWFAAIEHLVKNDLLPGRAYADTTSPQLQRSVPADGALSADHRKPIVLTFSEPVQLGEGAIVLTSGEQQQTLDSEEVMVDYRRVIIAPSKPLLPESDVVVRVELGAVCDLQGNAVQSIDLAFRTRPHTNALYETNFDQTDSDWRSIADVKMSVRDGALTCNSNGQCAYIYDKEKFDAPQLVYSAKIAVSGAERCGLLFCVRDGSHAYALAIERGGAKAELHRIDGNLHQFNLNGNTTKIAEADLSSDVASGYRLRVHVDSQAGTMSAEVDGTPVFQNYALDGPLNGSVGFISSWNGQGAWIDGVKVAEPSR